MAQTLPESHTGAGRGIKVVRMCCYPNGVVLF